MVSPIGMVVDHNTLDAFANTLAVMKSMSRVADLNYELRDRYVADGRAFRAES